MGEVRVAGTGEDGHTPPVYSIPAVVGEARQSGYRPGQESGY